MTDRDTFIEAARKQPEVTPAELNEAIGEGTLMFRFLGKLFREQLDFENTLIHMDLVSEEGRMVALRQQGIVQGRAMLLEAMVDMFLEGEENGRSELDAEPELELVPRRVAAAAAG